ncbi:VWA domain-containing protein [Flavobacteriaceae bacterium LMO-SS05]
MQIETILLIILAGILALSLALFQYLYQSKNRSGVYKLLAFLRFLTFFSVLLLLINPKFDKITYYNEKPNLIIALDNSESIAYLNQDEKAKTLVESLMSNDSLNTRFNLEFYTFGKDLNASGAITFKEKQSNLAKIFKRLSEVHSHSISPTILITDGNQTYGNDYQFSAQQYKQPTFPVILGDTTTYSDLKIEQLNVNKYAYLKNKFPVEIMAVYTGNMAMSTQLKITSESGVVHSQPLHFNSSKTSQVIQVTLPADKVGVQSYKAELQPLDNEKNKINNIKNFAVEVMDQKTNVAIVSDIIHPDLGALKKAIESNEQRSASILSPEDYLNQVNDFQMVILYQPNNTFRLVYQEIERLKRNSFVILGTKTDWQFLNGIQSHYKQEISRQTENFQPALNQNYGVFIIDDLNFNDFPPLQTEFGKTAFNIPETTILYKTIHGIRTDEPLLATFEINDRRGAVLNGEGVWRWRAQSFMEDKSFNAFDNFIGKLVQYLSSNQSRSRLNLNYESFYNGNDDVKITAQFFNKNYEFESNASLNINLININNKASSSLPFILKNNSYQVDLSALEPGDYRFTVSVTNENMSKSGTFKILDYNIEQQFLNANVSKLQQLAINSSGKSYFIDQISGFANDFIKDNRFATIQKSNKNVVSLIDWKILLGIISLSLAAEWFIRKFNGLI